VLRNEFLLLPGDGFLLIHASGQVAHLDGCARDLLGEDADLISGSFLRDTWPELDEAIQAHGPWDDTSSARDVDVPRGQLSLPIRLFRTDDGVGVGLRSDVDEQQRMAVTDVYRLMLGSLTDVVLVTTAEPIEGPGPLIVYANDALLRRTGFDPREVLGRSPRLLLGPDTDADDRRILCDAWASGSPVRVELLNQAKDGTEFWAEVDLSPILDESGRHSHWIAVQRDITERREATQAMFEQALRDTLTGLPNREALRDRLDQALRGLPRHPEVVALLYCDLDDFKQVNESLGHPVGDQLLRELASRMASVLRPDDTLARLGGDEFVVLCEGMKDAATAAHLAVRLQERIGARWIAGDEIFYPQMSVGIAVTGDKEESGDELLRRADIALYQAKGAGKNRVEVYDAAADTKTQFALAIQHDLRAAIDSDRLVVEYQPVARLADCSIVGAEALVRVMGRDGVPVPAGEFVPLAEMSGLVVPMGEWVLHRALADLKDWRSRGIGHDLSINVSPTQIREPGFAVRFLKAVVDAGIDPHWLIVEVTETTLIHNPDRTAQELARLREAGVGVALDDFGTGYSSFSWLTDFPLSCVKIDRKHTQSFIGDARVAVIVRALVKACLELGLDVVGEGIETEEQRDRLRDMGCQFGQGYLFGRSTSPTNPIWG
jgi:diguanylate cyclase (GGDEF)-like protein/PAS domain S-box-containing protein